MLLQVCEGDPYMCLWFSMYHYVGLLIFMRFLRSALECHYARLWYRWPAVIWRFSTYFITCSTVCLVTKEI